MCLGAAHPETTTCAREGAGRRHDEAKEGEKSESNDSARATVPNITCATRHPSVPTRSATSSRTTTSPFALPPSVLDSCPLDICVRGCLSRAGAPGRLGLSAPVFALCSYLPCRCCAMGGQLVTWWISCALRIPPLVRRMRVVSCILLTYSYR